MTLFIARDTAWVQVLYKTSVGLLCLLSAVVLTGCASMIDNAVADAIIQPDSAIKARSVSTEMGPHMLMTERQPVEADDKAYAAVLVSELRQSIERFKDVEVAKEAGYRSFPPEPGPDLKEIHYVNTDLSADEAEHINPRKPGSLLYHRTDSGGLKLVGAMFTAPASASPQELNNRVPLSITQWHLHTNICLPIPLWDEDEWARRLEGGEMVFGPDSPVASKRACDAVGGRFAPSIFGWMAHAYVFANDPDDIWNPQFGHQKSGHSH